MPPAIASAVFAVGIAGLFWLDRDQKARTSGALWIPVLWLSIVCSRPASLWFGGRVITSADQILEGSPFDRLVYAILLIIGLLTLLKRRRQVGRILRANGPILLFLFYSAVSVLWSDYPGVAFKRLTKGMGDVAMVLIVFTDPEPLAAFKRLLARLAYVLIPLSILFIKYYPVLGRDYNPWGMMYYTGVTTNKNTLGVICLCFGLAALWRFLAACQDHEAAGRSRRIIANSVLLAMILWLFLLVNSMTSLSCFVMASTLLLAANSRVAMRRSAVVHLLIGSMLAVSVSVLFFGVIPGALGVIGRNATLTDRTRIWAELLSLVRDPVFGTGFESFWLGPRLEAMWRMEWWQPNEAHNGYLEVFLNLGWIGVALLLVVIVTGYRTAFCAWRNNALTGSLSLAYFFTGLVYNFTEAAFFRMQGTAWIFFLFAITNLGTTSYHKIRSSTQKPFEHPDPLVPQNVVNTN